jgi:NAD(P)-dependent dehydrogenase (short-subunit alcohol dehydrogenase family)
MEKRVELQGKTAIVTGGAVRLGREISIALAAKGVNVCVAYNSSEDAAMELTRNLPNAVAVKCDVRDEADVKRMFELALERFKTVDILVNNAAVFSRTPVDRLTTEEFDSVIEINLRGSYLCALEAARIMSTQQGGKIIQIADVGGIIPWSAYMPYSISKAGVIMMVKCMARAFAPHVQVNAIAPGVVLPEEGLSEEEIKKSLSRNAIKRTGSPEEVTNAILFLLNSDYITGETIVIDGGRHLS